jgi:HlyD family secretion protein
MALAAALVVAALVWGFRPQPPIVDAATAGRAPLRVTVEEEGRTRVRQRYVVSAPVSGFLRRLPWNVGDPVRAGDVVAEIEPPRVEPLDPRTREQAEARVAVAQAATRAAEQRVRTAEEQVRTARLDAAYWRQERDRAAPLLEAGDIAKERYDKLAFEMRRAESAVRTAEETAATARVEVETARAEIQAARAALVAAAAGPNPAREVVAVRAPAGGRVLRLVRESEGAVARGEALVEIGDARALEVEIEVLSADAVRMGPGTRVIFTRWGGEPPLEGWVRVVEPLAFTKISALGVEEQRVRTIADITSPEELWRRLGDGYRVEASFVLWEAGDVLQVPAAALFRHDGEWAVFVVENGAARRRMVKVGQRTGLAAQILEGVEAGERVIVHPDDAVADGGAVEVRS